MSEFTHPALRAELKHLEKTLNLIAGETERYAENEARLKALVETLREQAAGAYDEDLFVQEIVYRNVSQTLLGLVLSKDAPYFTRVDFLEDGETSPRTHYIGKYSVVDSDSLDWIVVDWRSPIANLYYAGQLGPVDYTVPDGRVSGELMLKRQFDIQSGVMRSFFDADMVSQDKLLHEALSVVGAERLREVVTTIQAEQNAVIRHPMRSLVVQGVAGSGKTTIALHRIAYLLYAHRKTLPPGSLLILAPNPLFLSYISDVLPELGVSDALQMTFESLARTLMGDRLPQTAADDRLAAALADASTAESLRRVSRRKGSEAYLNMLEAFLKDTEPRLIPPGDIKFGPAMLYSHDDVINYILNDHAGFPFIQRIDSFKRNLKKKAKTAMMQVKDIIMKECERRVDLIKAAMPDSPERRERLTTLYNSRDTRLKEADGQLKPYIKAQLARWSEPTPLDIYKRFIEETDCLPDGDTQGTLDMLGKKRIEQDDMPAMLIIDRWLNGFDEKLPIRHIVIDEAQDLNPNQFAILKSLFISPTFTIVGDIGQSIHFYKGVDEWGEASGAIGGAEVKTLTTSYRNTVEIMSLANAIAKRHAYPGQALATPVLRHADKPSLFVCDNKNAMRRAIISTIERYQTAGYVSIALIERTQKQAEALHKALNDMHPGICSLLDQDKKEYRRGVTAAACAAVKGLEFDAVIIADASDGVYADTRMDMRLMYVAMTRPLHALSLFAHGAPTPLFDDDIIETYMDMHVVDNKIVN